MEQHSLPETADSEVGLQPVEMAVPKAPQHEHSDSMVTIRLSQTDAEVKKEDITIDTSVGGGAPIEQVKGLDHEADRDALGIELEIASTSTTSTVKKGPTESIVEVSVLSEASEASEIESESAIDTVSVRSSTEILISEPRKSVMLGSEQERAPRARSSSASSRSSKSSGSSNVNWSRLDMTEEQEERDEATDESTAFLLARLEQENNALATDPKAQISRSRSESRPPSFQQLKKLVSEPQNSPLRYSLLPAPPPMTELEFWSALVRNYPQTAQRLPTLTSNKIRNGIPPPLRGVVWQSIAGARDTSLEEEYERLALETSPHEKLILKDIGRSFPGVDMFRDPDGEGQKMLGKVLNAFSLYDPEIGYCQGLGFVVGPLLMHMGDKEAFCVLVRLIMHYDLRSCFLPDLSGLHLRIFQFQHLLAEHLPALTAHLDKMSIEPLYLSQWFLSFFGVTCPLPMLIRIYDVILTEGASETLMRVALSLMRRNEKKILAAVELEDVMQLLLSRGLWDTYGCNADDLVQDFCDWTGLVTCEKLQSLEDTFKNNMSPTTTSKPSVHTAAARFLGRFWAGSGGLMSPKSPSASSLAAPGRPASVVRRTPSKQSMASTLNSIEGSEASTHTEGTEMSGGVSGDWVPQKPAHAASQSVKIANKDRGLHSQIEDLLTALSDLQREHSQLASQLQREREERDEERLAVKDVLEKIKRPETEETESGESEGKVDEPEKPEKGDRSSILASVFQLEERFATTTKRSSLVHQTKQQLREEVQRWKESYNQEVARTADLTRQLGDQEREIATAREDVREARSRVQVADREKNRLEKTNQELRSRSRRNTLTESDKPCSPAESTHANVPTGLREFKLGRASTAAPRMDSNSQSTFSKRVSSLSTQSILATEDNKPANEDALLVELVAAKTSEAVARQELEEVKAKLDSLRKLLGGNASTPGRPEISPLPSHSKTGSYSKGRTPSPSSGAAVTGGFFSGWGKRVASSGQ